MKPTVTLFLISLFVIALLAGGNTAHAQQYKIKQTSSMQNIKSETTIYVKGMRKRTEGGGFAGMKLPTAIEQCDLQRTIKINDKKKLYFIIPFSNNEEIEEDARPSKAKPVATVSKPKEKTGTKKGGVIYMYYNITDTGERKKMYGITARHVWSTQKIKPSADACMMKDSMIIKTDGWYIDLPQFNCQVNSYGGTSAAGGWQKPECQDRFISKHSGKGKLGFPLIEKRIMIMGGQVSSNEFESNIETLEFSMVKLDSMLFEIPPGYQLAKSEEDLQDKFDATDYIKSAYSNKGTEAERIVDEEKKAGITRIGVYEPTGDEQLQADVLQKHMANSLTGGNIEAVVISSKEDAKKYHCDFLLNTVVTKVKQGSKVGGLLKAIKNTDPSSATSFIIEANLSLVKTSDESTRAEQKINGKYDGKADEAAMKALEKGCGELVKELD